MKTPLSTIFLAILTYLATVQVYAQHDKSLWEPFIYHAGAAGQKEPKEITSLRHSYQQFMQVLSSSAIYNFNGLRSASHITVGTSPEESLHYLIEASQIIRRELVEQLPVEVLLDDLKNFNLPVATSSQGMILNLRKDLDLFRAQMAHAH